MISNLGALHYGAGANAEPLPTAYLLPATERHGLVLAAGLDVERAAVRAADTFRPALSGKPFLCFRVGWKLPQDRFQADTLAIRLARRFLRFRHTFILYESAQTVKRKRGVLGTYVYNPQKEHHLCKYVACLVNTVACNKCAHFR